jgi:hypothetical protein
MVNFKICTGFLLSWELGGALLIGWCVLKLKPHFNISLSQKRDGKYVGKMRRADLMY